MSALVLATLAGCASPSPLTAPEQPSPAASPILSVPPDVASPKPRPVLPPVKDATGLPGDRLVAAPRVRLQAAGRDGTARLVVPRPGFDRTYLLAPARRVVARTRPAMVLVLPAANTNLRTEYDRYDLDALRDHGATVVVVGNYASSWNAGGCCGRAQADGVDDVAAVAAVRDDAVRRSGADPRRVAVMGHSVGALMAWRLACTPSFGAAAAIAVSGTLTATCPRPLARVPDLLALHGEQDASVPLDGSDRVVPLLGVAPPSVRESASRVATSAGCSAPVTTSATTSWGGCAGGGSVTLTVVPGRGHPWEDLDATRRTAAFLKAVLPGVR